MSLWVSILGGTEESPEDVKRIGQQGDKYGCNNCSLNCKSKRKVINLDRIKGRRGFLWAQCPGKWENLKGLELVGKAGQWLWKRLAKHGLSREDLDVQNVVRCRPTNGEGKDRDPSPEEIRHCSVYTTKALRLNRGRAKVYLVCGKIAQKALLKGEYKKDRPVFWSPKLQAYVYCLDHPSYLMRGYAPDWRLREFDDRVKAAAWVLKQGRGRFAFLHRPQFRVCHRASSLRLALAKIRKAGVRVSVDIEDGLVQGQRRVLMVGLSWEKDKALSFVFDHPEAKKISKEERQEKLDLLKEFLEDRSLKKIFHFGSYDVPQLRKLFGIRVRGYEYDTTYANYLRYTFRKSHGLDAISAAQYPEYAGYKEIIAPFTQKDPNFANIPLKVLGPYNCGDVALTKRLEMDTSKDVPLPLLKSYIWAGFTLTAMEGRGPVLDAGYLKALRGVIPAKVTALSNSLRVMAGDPNLNPNTATQVAKVMYDKLGLPEIEGSGRGTAKEVLQLLHQSTGHPFPKDLQEYRRLSKIDGTYLKNYEQSARLNDGELRTRWYLTGAVTGRLRSGGSKDKRGIINMQNLHGDPVLQNLLVSDPSWRDILQWTGGPVPDELLDLEILVCADYSQIEIRMLAECSGDPRLTKAFIEASKLKDPKDPRADIHCLVGNALNPEWSLEFIKKDKPTRTFIKNCHFGLIYGLDAMGLYYYLLARGVDTSEEKAEKFHTDYFRTYKGVARFIELMREFAREHGYVETIFGFRRRLGEGVEEDRTTNPENQAVNSPIQGAAHQLVLMALGMLHLFPRRYNLLQKCIMEVHDALVFRIKLRDLKEAVGQLHSLLEVEVPVQVEKVFKRKLKVPLVAEMKAGFRYGALVEYQKEPLGTFLKAWKEENAKVDGKAHESYGLPLAA